MVHRHGDSRAARVGQVAGCELDPTQPRHACAGEKEPGLEPAHRLHAGVDSPSALDLLHVDPEIHGAARHVVEDGEGSPVEVQGWAFWVHPSGKIVTERQPEAEPQAGAASRRRQKNVGPREPVWGKMPPAIGFLTEGQIHPRLSGGDTNMSRSIAHIVSAGLAIFLTACEKPAQDPLEKAKETTKPGVEAAKTAGESGAADIKKATASTTETAKEVGAIAKEGAVDAGAVISSTFSVDKLKAAAASLEPAKLQEIADKIVSAIKEKATDLPALKDLKAKLQVVVDQLKAKGVDVSKYTGFLLG